VPEGTDAQVFTVELCQHRWPRFGRALCRTRYGPICQKTARRKYLWCRCCD